MPISDEFAQAEINDRRLVKRLCHTAELLARQPEKSISAACGSWNDAKAAYELFDNEKVSREDMLESHRKCTIERMKGHKILLGLQDTTSLDFNTHLSTEGLGPVNDSVKSLGLLAHTLLIVTPQGVPLGVLAEEIWARDMAEHGKRDQRKEKTTSVKESSKWGNTMDKGLKDVPDNIMVVTVCDREGDIFDFAAKAVAENRHLLFRVAQNRGVESEYKLLFVHVNQAPVLGRCMVDVPRKSGNGQAQRQAWLTVKACRVTVKPPLKRAGEHLAPVVLYAVEAREEHAPTGITPLHWLLLTTLAVETFQDAMEKIGWYRQRWKIERFHYILKSGCRIEDIQLETRARLEKAITLYAVIAWRLAWITYQARETPDMPCSAIFSQMEWQALWRQTHPGRKPPVKPPALKDAVLWLAMLGGFLGRKGDGNPGVKVLWSGLHNLNIGMRFLAES